MFKCYFCKLYKTIILQLRQGGKTPSNKERYEMKFFPFFERQMLFLALLYNAFHILVSLKASSRNSTCLHTVYRKPLSGKLIFTNTDNPSGPWCRKPKLPDTKGTNTLCQGRNFFIHSKWFFDRNEAVYFFRTFSEG